MCQQGGRDLVGAICDGVSPERTHISIQDDHRRARIGGQHEPSLGTQRPRVAMDDQWRSHQTPRHGELMQRGARTRRGRDQRERRNRLRVGCRRGDALHHVGTLDAKLAEQANDPISRRDAGMTTSDSTAKMIPTGEVSGSSRLMSEVTTSRAI
jgi:hypothetical protein